MVAALTMNRHPYRRVCQLFRDQQRRELGWAFAFWEILALFIAAGAVMVLATLGVSL